MESGNWKAEAVLGAVVVGVIVVFVWLTFSFGGGAPRNAKPYVFLFDSALGLSIDNTVAIAGVRIGVVDEISVEGRTAKVTVLVTPEIVLHQDARAAVRQKTLLGEKFVDINPGTDATAVLAAGSVVTNNEPTIDIDKIMRDASVLLEQLNRITPPIEQAVTMLDSALREESGSALVGEAAGTLTELRTLVREATSLVHSSSDDVAALLRMARSKGPPLLDRLDSVASHADDLLAVIDPKSIKTATDLIGPAADNIGRITTDAKTAMGDVRDAAKRLDGVLARIDLALQRLEWIDEPMIREFLQVQGVRVNLLPDAAVTARIKKLRESEARPPAPTTTTTTPAIEP